MIGDRQIHLPCDCGCEVVLIAEWDDFQDDPREAFVEFYTTYRDDRWRHRIRQAWRTLRNRRSGAKGAYYHAVLWQGDQLDRLETWLSQRHVADPQESEGEG